MYSRNLFRVVVLINGIAILILIAYKLEGLTNDGSTVYADKEKLLVSVQMDRIKTMRDNCQNRNRIRIQSYQITTNVLLSNNYRFVFCYIFKVASTQWIRLLLLLSGFQQSFSDTLFAVHEDAHRHPELRLNSYPQEEIVDKLNTFKKVVFVREPLERLLSAYRSKILGSLDRQFKDIKCVILKKYRGGGDDVCKNSVPTFPEFVDYVIDHFSSDYNETTINKHWERYTRLCSPCSIQYDFIGKYETFQDDVEYVLKSLGSPANISMIPRNAFWYGTAQKTSDTFRKFYSSINVSKIIKLLEIYKEDYALFGYSMTKALQKLGLK